MMNKTRAVLYLFIVCVIAGAVFVAGDISFDSDPDPYALIPAEDRKALESFESSFGRGEPMTLIVLENSEKWDTYEEFLLLRDATDWWKRDTIEAVSIANVPFPVKTLVRIKKEPFLKLESKKKFEKWIAKADRFSDITGKFLSENRKYALIFVYSSEYNKKKITTFKKKFESEKINVLPLNYEEIESELQSNNQRESLLLAGISLLIILLLFYVMTGSLRGLGFILAMISFSLSLTALFIYFSGIQFSVHMVAIPCMLVVLSFTDLMHLLYAHHAIRNEVENDRALRRELAKTLHRPMLLTSLTNIVGFVLFLFLANNMTLTEISLVSIAGVVFAFLSSRYLAIFLLRKDVTYFPGSTGNQWIKLHEDLINALRPKRKMLLIGSTALTLLLGFILFKTADINNVPFVTSGKSESFEAAHIVSRNFFGDRTASIHFKYASKEDFWNEETMRYLEKAEKKVDALFHPVVVSSPTIIAKRYHRFQRNGHPGAFTLPLSYTDEFLNNTEKMGGSSVISKEANNARIQFSFEDIELKESLKKMDALEKFLSDNPPPDGVTATLSGRAYLNDHATYNFSENILYGILLSILFGAIVVFIYVKNFSIGIATLIANTLPLLVAIGVMQLSGSQLNPISLFFFTVIMGLCVDDSIYLILHRKAGSKGAVYPIAITSAVLAIGFASFLFSTYDWIQPFGWIFISGILVAFLFDAFLLVLFTDRNSTFDANV